MPKDEPISIDAIQRTLFGSPDGWSTTPIIKWLTTNGRHITKSRSLVNQVCERLHAAGAPIWRVRFSFRTIHPQVAGLLYTWNREQGATEAFRAPHGIRESEDYIGSPIEYVHQHRVKVRRRLDALDPQTDHPILHRIAATGGVDYVVMPLIFSDGVVNTFIVTTDHASGFSDDDIEKFEALANFLIPIFEVIETRRVATALLDTYVGHRTGEKILHGLIKRGDGETIRAALWFSDLRDFTALTEQLPLNRMLGMLNSYFEFIAAAVTQRGGEILRFIGDAMLIVFPADSTNGGDDGACAAALEAALDSFQRLAALNAKREQDGEPLIHFGLGLHVGEVVYGNVGAPDRLDFTVMGQAVNRTARLEDLTKELGVSLLMSEDFTKHIDAPVASLGHHALKGVAEPQEAFALNIHLEDKK